MSYRLGVDVGGTFTDLLLINEDTGETHTAKVPSTPEDSSIGVLNGIARICDESGIDPTDVHRVMHGTTVATNAVLTGKGARVGLVTTAGYEDTLQVARSFCPGGLGGWVSFVKKPLLAPLELTIGAAERIGADGQIVRALDEEKLRADLRVLYDKGAVQALTICFINAYLNGEHERRARDIAGEIFTDTPISISSEVVPEMQEYERTETTVVNSYVRPEVAKYVRNLQAALEDRMGSDTQLSILRSDGGLASARGAGESPVNLLMSGPAGGVSGAIYFCSRAGFDNILTFDMGGTSTDVALIQNSRARVRRETIVGDVRVRAPFRGRENGRRRRRLDSLCAGADKGLAGRARVRRSGARARLLHEGRRAAHGVRRQRGAGLFALRCPARRQDGYQPGRFCGSCAKSCRRHGHRPDGGRGRNLQDRQRIDVRRTAAGVCRAGL